LSFFSFALSSQTLRSVRDRGHHQPTAIQAGAIPVVLAGRDLVATAETGSGKTAVFLLPLLDRLHSGRFSGINALILAPTRELAAQIGREFQLLCRNTHLGAAVIVGGEPMSRQIADLRGAQLVVGCPGRVIDHIERGTLNLDRIDLVVIDEADRMLDMGFLPQLRRVLCAVRKPHQTLMFSATMDAGVEKVAREFLRDPARVHVGEVSAPPASVSQAVYAVSLENKAAALLSLLSGNSVKRTIVFTRTKSRADRINKMLARNGIRAVAIHGNRSQNQRNAALAGFRGGVYNVLVATDIAARGLDIPDVSHVINFDLPETPDSYIHRIGRTARMGKAGTALNLVTPEDGVSLRAIERTLGARLERTKIDGIEAPEMTLHTQGTIARMPVMLHRAHARPRQSNIPSRKKVVSFGER